jgi:GDP-fucose transporter C1
LKTITIFFLDTFSVTGTIYGVIGALSLSLLAIYTKKVLPMINYESWLLNFYIKFYTSLLLIPIIFTSGDNDKIRNYKEVDKGWFWALMILSGFCSLGVGVLSIIQIKLTSALTHIISSLGKGCLITVLATHFYNESKSSLWWLSNIVVTIGILMYTTVKQFEMQKEHRKIQECDKENHKINLV